MENPSDPTHTLDLRIQAYNEVIRRYELYADFVFAAISMQPSPEIAINLDLSDLEGIEDENEYYELLILLLGEKAYEIILGEDREAGWFKELIAISYFRGRRVAETDIPNVTIENPAYHAKKLRLVDEKAIGNLTKNVNQMVLSIQGALKDAQVTDINLMDIKDTLDKMIRKTGVNSATRTTRTEIIYANQVATVFQGDLVQSETGVEVVYRWQTREDSRVRSTHAARNGNLYSREMVIPLLGEPNCRCAIHPVLNGSVPTQTTFGVFPSLNL